MAKSALMIASILVPISIASGLRNVVFIVADDLRPWPELSSLSLEVPDGLPSAHTPNMEKFVRNATRFTRAYAQIAVCAPSRTSFLTGRYPDSTRIWTIGPYFRAELNKYDGDGAGDRAVTMPQHFLQNGFNATGFGKVFHDGNASGDPLNASNPSEDIAYSWFDFDASPGFPGDASCQSCMLDRCNYTDYPGNYSWTDCPCRDECFEDGATAVAAEKRLGEVAEAWHKDKKNFFLGVGFHRPHLPFIAPSRFFSALPSAEDFPLAAHAHIPSGAPAIASSHSWECRANKDVEAAVNDTTYEAIVADAKARELRRGYYAARSFVDHCIGRVLGAIEENGLSDDTVVAIIGDHGWHLGEQGQWGKSTNWDHGTRVPLLLRAPHLPGSHGRLSEDLVELVDVFPTLVELSGLPLPQPSQQPFLQGKSLAPLLQQTGGAPLRDASFSQFPHDPACVTAHNGKECTHSHGYPQVDGRQNVMGYTLRTEEWRFTLWTKFDWDKLAPQWGETLGMELYSHAGDDGFHYDDFENENLAYDPEHASRVEAMTKQLKRMQKEKAAPGLEFPALI